MSVKPGTATTRTLDGTGSAGSAVGGLKSSTQAAPTPLEYGRQVQSDGLSARGDANT